MKKFVILLSLSAFASAQAQTLRSQVDAANKTIGRLMMAKDLKGLKKTMQAGMTPDFKYVESGQTQNFEMMSANMAMGIGSMKTLKRAEAKTLSLKETGNTATAMTSHVMEGTTVGPDKKPHTIKFSGTSEDRYLKIGGKWKMSSMAWVKQTMTMDGKPMSGIGQGK